MNFHDYDFLPPPPVNDNQRDLRAASGILRAVVLGFVVWVFAFAGLARCARGQEPPPCVPKFGLMAKQLARQYGEKPIGFGVAGSGRLITQFATEDGATWTFVATTTDGHTCLIASGVSWEEIPRGDPS